MVVYCFFCLVKTCKLVFDRLEAIKNRVVNRKTPIQGSEDGGISRIRHTAHPQSLSRESYTFSGHFIRTSFPISAKALALEEELTLKVTKKGGAIGGVMELT
ncbi:MAG: hypothetical protein JEZ06_24890 [Anaerolineaceae bacterium]|nr:hypothetical protein [Anaerolineaceae bacterium]